MKVALLTSNFGAAAGGAERQLERVLKTLQERGWDVVVIARRRSGTTSSPTGSPEGPLRVRRVGSTASSRASAITFTVAAAWATARERPDVAIGLQLGSAPTAAALATVLARRRIPFVVRLTGITATGSQLEVRGRTRRGRLTTRAMLRRSAKVVSPAQHLLDRAGPFGALLAGKQRVVRNGAPDFGQVPTRPPGRRVVWVGRPDPTKQYDHLLELARRLPELDFLAVGVTAADAMGSAPPPANVDAVGRLDADELRTALTGANAFVGTSRLEGVPNTVLEALAARLPVVAYDIPGTREAAAGVTHGVRLVPLGDIAALEAGLRESLADSRGIEGAVATIAEVTDDWERLLRDVASDAR